MGFRIELRRPRTVDVRRNRNAVYLRTRLFVLLSSIDDVVLRNARFGRTPDDVRHIGIHGRRLTFGARRSFGIKTRTLPLFRNGLLRNRERIAELRIIVRSARIVGADLNRRVDRGIARTLRHIHIDFDIQIAHAVFGIRTLQRF